MHSVLNNSDLNSAELSIETLIARLQREKSAREQAEELLENKSRSLYQANEALKKVAENLEGQRQQLNTILDHTVTGILLVNDRLNVVQSNKSANEMFGLMQDDLLDLNVLDLFERSKAIERLINIKLKSGSDDIQFEAVARLNGEGAFPAEVGISTIVKPDGRRAMVWIIHDITRRRRDEAKRKELEKELSQAQKLEALGTLASGVAHEINTPIQYVGDNMRFLGESLQEIVSLLELFQNNAGAEQIRSKTEEADIDFLLEEIPQAIEQSLKGLEQVAGIVKAIKEFSHPGQEGHANVDLNEVINTTLTVTRNQWKYVAEIDLELEENLSKIPCNKGDINQVLVNLIVNAADAIAECRNKDLGRIAIKTSEADGWLTIEVSDTGCGMPKDIQDRMFDPFFTTKDVGKGTGQGLAISYNIIRTKHKGEILCESQQGKGSRFIVKLPISPDTIGQLEVLR
ncbi:sensor histidine kinase [Hirschia litorea]|uniref:histidine kinase n=1 Tax=Hirschia litorea TaxID=1199156 RepID=A0ABW2IIG1_9PROT